MTVEETELTAAWADEMIELEARKAYPGELGKEEIQALTGIGPGDLRAVLTRMLEAGSLTEGEDGGYVYVDEPDRQPIGQRLEAGTAGDAESDGEEDGVEDPGNALEDPEEPVGAAREALPAGSYRAFILLEVEFEPEPDEDEGEDDAALRESRDDLLIAAANGVLGEYPGLTVKPQLIKLEAFGLPRRVYPE